MFLIGLLLCQTKIQFAREQGILVLFISAVIAALAVGFSFDFFFLSSLSFFLFCCTDCYKDISVEKRQF